MPTYEYICEACEHEFERFQSITAPPVRTCPECSRKKVRRKIGTGAGIIFKGGGFYETDYRSESYKKAADADKPASDTKPAADSKPAETKAESKPEPKPAAKADTPAKSAKPKKKAD